MFWILNNALGDVIMILKRIRKRLEFIYGAKITDAYFQNFVEVLEGYKQEKTRRSLWDEEDVFLITYGDSIKKAEEFPLQTLNNFVANNLKDAVSVVHVLPFFPYSSDGGFSVIDFNEVNPELGDWSHIKQLTSNFRVMADLVVNHISASSEWVKQFEKGEAPGKDYILTVDEDFDCSQVVRPRSTPLLTDYNTPDGVKKVWTTFSDDQIDLNYFNPDLMLAMLEVLMSYVAKGVSVIRLDAIAFLWKHPGSTCVHQPETHEAVKLMRDVLDHYAPGTVLLTETNVPHKENISYFGSGDEAHMVYQFSLPPLLLHTLHRGNSTYLTSWALKLNSPGYERTNFNFTASHDGIGLRPLEGLLPEDEKNALFTKMREFGGRISTRRQADGTDVPYELNITYYDALKGTMDGEDEWQLERFIASQTIMMALQGIPAIYIHSLLGTHNYQEGVEETNHNRDINRRRWDADEIMQELGDEASDHAKVFEALVARLKLRRQIKAFHPDAAQRIMTAGNGAFAVLRHNFTTGDKILSVTNVTNKELCPEMREVSGTLRDIITGESYKATDFQLAPYQTVWLVEELLACTI